MKRFLRIIPVLLIFIFTGPSCEMLDDCKFCRYVTYEDGVMVDEGSEVEYCGEDLLDIEDQDPVVIGNMRSEYECF